MAMLFTCFPEQEMKREKITKAIYLYKFAIGNPLNYHAKIQQIMRKKYFICRKYVLME